MADPVSMGTMAAISLGTTAAGAGVSALGAASSADSTTAMFNYKAGVARANAVYAGYNATYATEAGEINAESAGLRAGQKLADITVDQARSGFDVNSGTGVAVRKSQIAGDIETQGIIRNDAARKAYGFLVEGMDFQAEAGLDVAAGQNAQTAGEFNIASSLLGGASSVASKWMQFKQAGVFG